MMNIDALRKSGELQSHHWHAAQYYMLIASNPYLLRRVGRECRELQAISDCYGIDPYVLLNKAIVERAVLGDDPKVIGVLREALNTVNRLRTRH